MNTSEQQAFDVTDSASNYYFAHMLTPNVKKSDYYKHNHTRYELYVFFNGDGEFAIEDRIYRMTPGMILLIPPRTYHYASVTSSDHPYERLVINFDRVFVYPELHSLLNSDKNPFSWDESKHGQLLRDVEKCLNAYKTRDKYLIVQMFLNRLLIDMKYMQRSLLSSQELNPTVTQILTYINEHINEPLSLKTISENVFLNQSYMSQVFTSYMKIGIMDYVKQKKIYIAEEMIRSEGISPTEASRRLGFTDYSTFYRLYKKYMKALPSAK